MISSEQWVRANLRAVLREAGYDAVGARTIPEALAHPVREPGRGAVGVILVDQSALQGPVEAEVESLRVRHSPAAMVLLAPGDRAPAPGRWERIVRRPVSIERIVAAVRSLLPLPPGAAPIDDLGIP